MKRVEVEMGRQPIRIDVIGGVLNRREIKDRFIRRDNDDAARMLPVVRLTPWQWEAI